MTRIAGVTSTKTRQLYVLSSLFSNRLHVYKRPAGLSL
jgi:hypothetical protein